MATVAVSGFIVGYRIRTSKNDNPYGVVDLLQIGDSSSDSNIIYVLIYDEEIKTWLQDRYLSGQIVPISIECKILSQDRKNMMWICNKIFDLKADVRKKEKEKLESFMAEILLYMDDLESFYKETGKEDLYISLLDFKNRLLSG